MMKKLRKGIVYLLASIISMYAGMGETMFYVKAEITEEVIDSRLSSDMSSEGKVLNIRVWNDEFPRRFAEYYPGFIAKDNDNVLAGGWIGDVEVNFLETVADDYAYQNNLDAILPSNAGMPSDDRTDMFLVEADYAMEYIDTDYVMPISDLGITDSELSKQYQYTKDIATDSNGVLKGVTWQVCPGVMVYNREAAKEVLGFDDPTEVQQTVSDWDRYNETANKLNEAGYKMTATVNDTFRVFSCNVTSPWVVNDEYTIDSNIEKWAKMMKEQVDKGITGTGPLWGSGWSNGFYSEGKVFCYFGPAWVIDFCMAADDASSIAGQGGWAACEGPQGFSWGGTWLCAAQGTDNADLVSDIIRKLTTDDEIMTAIAKETGDQVNNMNVMDALAQDTSMGDDVLGGQNALAQYNANAKRIRHNYITNYDQSCRESFQSTMLDYFKGYFDTYDEAVKVFKDCMNGDVKATYLQLLDTALTMHTGERIYLDRTVIPSVANLTWTSTNKDVITVNEYGALTAMGEGAATITVENRASGLTASCEIIVTDINQTDSLFYEGGELVGGKTKEGFSWRLINSRTEVSINGYYGMDTEIEFPSEINGLKVTAIGYEMPWYENVYYPSKTIKVVIPNTVVSIGKRAFEGCLSLASVTIPDSVTNIEGMPFSWCGNLKYICVSEGSYAEDWAKNNKGNDTQVIYGEPPLNQENGFVYDNSSNTIEIIAYLGLEKNVVIPAKINNKDVVSIGENAFRECVDLENIQIPHSVANIGDGAFYNCDGLTNVTIPNSVTNIGRQAFRGCDGLIEIIIPENVLLIEGAAFEDCSNLERIDLQNKKTEIGDEAFYATKWYYNQIEEKSMAILNGILLDGIKCSGNIVIPDEVTKINYGAFADDNGCEITGVIIPDSVTEIGDYAFSNCPELETISIPDSVTVMGKTVFYNCGNLKNVRLPIGIKKIETNAFEDCKNLSYIEIPKGVTVIGDYAFYNCALANVEIPYGVTQIEEYAFAGCPIEKVVIPSSVDNIDDNAFKECPTTMVVNSPEGSYAEDWAKNHGFEVKYTGVSDEEGEGTKPGDKQGESDATPLETDNSKTDIQTNTQVLNSDMSSNDNALGETVGAKVTFGNAEYTVTVNENEQVTVTYTAPKSKKKTSYIIPDTITLSDGTAAQVTEIAPNAFKKCKKLKEVTIGKNIEKIGKNAFSGCKNLKTVTIKTTKLTKKSFGKNAFKNITKKATITVPKKQYKNYKKWLKATGIPKGVKINKK